MGFLAFLAKKEHHPLLKLNEAEIKAAEVIIARYKTFYEKHSQENICLYGLMEPDHLISPFHEPVEAAKRSSYAFPFQKACVFETIDNLKLKLETILRAAYGNVPIATEGCNIFWILITGGPHAGEVWLLTEYGLTPAGEKLTLEKWYKALTGPDPGFWYDPLSEWGQERDEFFFNHAAVKMADISENVFTVASPLCLTCQNMLGKIALREDTYFVVTDPVYTYIFGADPPKDVGNGWILTDLQNGVKFYKTYQNSIPQEEAVTAFG